MRLAVDFTADVFVAVVRLAVLFLAVEALAVVRFAVDFATGRLAVEAFAAGLVVVRFAVLGFRAGLAGSGPVFSPGWGAAADLRQSAPLGDLAQAQCLGLLSLVRVLGAGVDLELPGHRAPEPVLRQHPSDRLLDREGGLLGEELGVLGLGEAARVPRVPVRDLGLALAARDLDALRVHHDDVVAGVHVGREDRLVLAPKDRRGLRRETSEHSPAGVDHVPAALDVARSRRVGLHTRRCRPERPDDPCYLRFRRGVKGGPAGGNDEHGECMS